MAEEKQKAPGSSDVLDFDDLKVFHQKHPEQEICPVCDNTDWFVLHDERGNVSAIPWSDGNGEIAKFGLPVVTLFCTKCGFVRQHFLDALNAYMKELRKDE